MDYKKKLVSLIAVDAILVALIVFGLLFSPRSKDARALRRNILASAAEVSSIRIEGDGQRIELIKSGATWVLSSDDGPLPADGVRVDSFLKAVDSVTSLEPVAKERSALAGLGLGEGLGRRVVLADSAGLVLCDFNLGKYAAAPGFVYLSLGSGPEAYMAASGMASYVLAKRSAWLDLRIWTSPPATDTVQELRVRGTLAQKDESPRDFDYSVARSGNGWLSGSTVLDGARVEAMIRAIAALRGEDYAPLSESRGKATLSLEIRLGNGRSMSLQLEEAGADGRYPARSSQRDRALYLPAWALTEAIKDLAELKPASGS